MQLGACTKCRQFSQCMINVNVIYIYIYINIQAIRIYDMNPFVGICT